MNFLLSINLCLDLELALTFHVFSWQLAADMKEFLLKI